MSKVEQKPAAEKTPVWVVVADHRKARVFKRTDDGNLVLLDKMTSTKNHHLKHDKAEGAQITHEDAEFLKEVGLFDVYEGDKLEKGKKSYAVRFQLAADRTLKDAEVDAAMGRIRKALEKELGATLR